MKIETIKDRVEGVPYMSFSQAKEMTAFILENKLKSILELGFCHGVSTCYMAGAIDEMGGGSITTIDLLRARNLDPNIEALLSDLGLSKLVTFFYEPTSYIWRLMKMIEADSAPRFDLCYIDGAHNWATTGFAFFLVDKLLKPGGWMIFDDLNWTYTSSPALKNTDIVKKMPTEERNTPQVKKVYELLVTPHPSYENFSVKGHWGYAQKKALNPKAVPEC